MSKIINRLSGESDEPHPTVPQPQQLELLGPLPISLKDPPSITASIPPRNNNLSRGRSKPPQAEPILSPPEELGKLHAALADAETRMEALRMEITSLQDSREGERKSRLAGEQRIRELEEQIRGVPAAESGDTRQALDEAQTQLDDLRSQFRHLEGSHGEQAHQAEQRVKEQASALADAETQIEALRMEITSLQDSRERERKNRLAGEQRIRELEEQIPGVPAAESGDTRQALDKAQTQLDDLRSQFQHLEDSHGEQVHQAEQRINELSAAWEREKNELQAARTEIDRLAGEAAQQAEEGEESLIQARMRVEELETRLCAEAEIRSRSERQAGELQTRLDDVQRDMEQRLQAQAEATENRLREAEQQIRQLQAERDDALGQAQQARTLREQEAARFQERERLAAQRMATFRRVESPVSARLPTRALSASPLPWALFLVVILIACGGAFLLGRWQGKGLQSPDATQPAATSVISPGIAPRPIVPKPVHWPVIKGNFIRVQTASDRMTMVFDYPVFSRRTEIQPDAMRDLQKLARQLAPLTGTFRLEITGHTDADPVSSKAGEYSNNLDLGLKRAQTVREALIRQGGLPPEAMTAVSAGELNSPYPNTTPELRKKNRTVTIVLIPK
jgi:flagellar motor protein MotB